MLLDLLGLTTEASLEPTGRLAGYFLRDLRTGETLFEDDLPHLEPEGGMHQYAFSAARKKKRKKAAETIHRDSGRRATVFVSAMSHLEMTFGCTMLLTRGFQLYWVTPHLRRPEVRYFQVTERRESLKCFLHESPDFSPASEHIDFTVCTLLCGQQTPGFDCRDNLFPLGHLSFSLLFRDKYGSRQYLDLIAPDADIYDVVVGTLKGLILHAKHQTISKVALFEHSQRWQDAHASGELRSDFVRFLYQRPTLLPLLKYHSSKILATSSATSHFGEEDDERGVVALAPQLFADENSGSNFFTSTDAGANIRNAATAFSEKDIAGAAKGVFSSRSAAASTCSAPAVKDSNRNSPEDMMALSHPENHFGAVWDVLQLDPDHLADRHRHMEESLLRHANEGLELLHDRRQRLYGGSMNLETEQICFQQAQDRCWKFMASSDRLLLGIEMRHPQPHAHRTHSSESSNPSSQKREGAADDSSGLNITGLLGVGDYVEYRTRKWSQAFRTASTAAKVNVALMEYRAGVELSLVHMFYLRGRHWLRLADYDDRLNARQRGPGFVLAPPTTHFVPTGIGGCKHNVLFPFQESLFFACTSHRPEEPVVHAHKPDDGTDLHVLDVELEDEAARRRKKRSSTKHSESSAETSSNNYFRLSPASSNWLEESCQALLEESSSDELDKGLGNPVSPHATNSQKIIKSAEKNSGDDRKA
ncbi:unnamed protein product [Amoebophrya sp. A25]|nr:unnamed protein product [Amoebophrya sp. A25]|eukprot:GSA25T00007579001.1